MKLSVGVVQSAVKNTECNSNTFKTKTKNPDDLKGIQTQRDLYQRPSTIPLDPMSSQSDLVSTIHFPPYALDRFTV